MDGLGTASIACCLLPVVCCLRTDTGLAALTSMVDLRVLKLKSRSYAPPGGTIPTQYLAVSQLNQLDSLTVALPVLTNAQMESIAKLTGLQVSNLHGKQLG